MVIQIKALRKKVKNYVFSHNYWMYKAIRYGEFKAKQDSNKLPLVIYQMGKVGSSTIAKSLEGSLSQYAIYQIHVLSREWIEKVHSQYRYASKVHRNPVIEPHLLSSMYLRELIDNESYAKPMKVISLVRDPIARNISCFFQAFPIYFPEESEKLKYPYLDQHDVDRLIDIFINDFREHETPLRWFDVHIKSVFGIDVYDHPFPWDKGYQIIRSNDIELLLMRMESINQCATDALRGFLDIPGIFIKPDNISSDKKYSFIYDKFRKEIRIPDSMLKKMYSSKYMRHFYSNNEIQGLMEKWSI